MIKFFDFYTYGLSGYSSKSIIALRRRIYDLFLIEFNPNEFTSILDVGVSHEEHESSNTFEKNYPYKKNITVVSEADCSELEKIYKGLTFVRADGRNLPFENESFDYVYSHAVIEHVGNYENQITFIKELYRVSKSGLFITTPNRFHPIEFHTGLPLFHWLPSYIYFPIYKMLKKGYWADINSLNLISRSFLIKICRKCGLRNYKIETEKFLGFTSNLVLIIFK
jgi:hypothetical protein